MPRVQEWGQSTLLSFAQRKIEIMYSDPILDAVKCTLTPLFFGFKGPWRG